MAKPLPMRLQVEEIAFGKVFRMLSGMPGVVSIDIDAESPKRHYNKKNGEAGAPRGKRETGANSAICLILAALQNGPARRDVLGPALEAGGKSATSLNGQLFNAKDRGYVTGSNKDSFKITAKGKKFLAEACEVK